MKVLKQTGNNKTCPVIAIIKDGRILIGLRHYTPEKWKSISVWTLPGGRCDHGESLEMTLRREVGEEVGIAKLQVTNFLGTVPGSKKGDLVYVFVGNTRENPKLLEPEKFSEWKWEYPDRITRDFINPEALSLIKEFMELKQEII